MSFTVTIPILSEKVREQSGDSSVYRVQLGVRFRF